MFIWLGRFVFAEIAEYFINSQITAQVYSLSFSKNNPSPILNQKAERKQMRNIVHLYELLGLVLNDNIEVSTVT